MEKHTTGSITVLGEVVQCLDIPWRWCFFHMYMYMYMQKEVCLELVYTYTCIGSEIWSELVETHGSNPLTNIHVAIHTWTVG